MRVVVILLSLAVPALVCAPCVRAADGRLDWPLQPRPEVVRGFDAPRPNWQRGHRGVDLAGADGQPVYAAEDGYVVYAGRIADRPLVSVAHPGGLRTSYEPVDSIVRPGQRVTAGTPIGTLLSGHAGCPVTACLHWGAMWGASANADYVDPRGLVATTPVRLKPIGA